MLNIYTRDLLPERCITNAPEQTIVIAVNCVGAMGRGTALAIREKYPKLYHYYRQKCKSGEMHMNYLISAMVSDKQRVLLLPTKYDWKAKALPEEIMRNIDKLCSPETMETMKIESIATTYLGTGNGWIRGETAMELHSYLETALDNLGIPCSIYRD